MSFFPVRLVSAKRLHTLYVGFEQLELKLEGAADDLSAAGDELVRLRDLCERRQREIDHLNVTIGQLTLALDDALGKPLDAQAGE